MRQHPQADRRRVNLLNELADEQLRMIGGAGFTAMHWSEIDSLTTLAYALAHQLRYPRGDAYATFLNPRVALAAHSTHKNFDYVQWLRQEFVPLLEHLERFYNQYT